MQNLDAPTRQIAEHMHAAIDTLATQMDSLLDISKLDAGIVQPHLQHIDLIALLQKLSDEAAPVAKQKKLSLQFKYAGPISVNSDALLLERIFRNLLVNALKYTELGGISITVDRAGDNVNVAIRDTGCGIPDEERERIFEEFYQLHNPERDRSKGLGLGLSIVRRLVHLLNIRLHLQSSPQGSEFAIALPITHQDSEVNNASKSTTALWRPQHILVVDDEHMVAAGMKTLLENMQCTVTVADSSDAALVQSKNNKPDMVLADLRLRGNDNGIECIRRLRELYPNLPAAIISGDTAPDRLHEVRNANLELLHKPVSIQLLTKLILRTTQQTT